MGLSSDLISQFVKATNDKTKEKSESTRYGTIVEYNGSKYIRLDGSELLTPIKTTVSIKDGDRATVTIKDHTATVNGNLSDPAASSGTVTKIGSQISEFEIVIADKVSTQELEAERARIGELVADNVVIRETLVANKAEIDSLIAEDVTINGILTAKEADIENLKTTKLDATVADITYATIGSLEATDAKINNLEATYGDFEVLTTNKFTAIDGVVDNLKANKLDAETARITYATITDLNAARADIGTLNADVADIETLMFGSASGGSIQTSFANAVIAQLGNAQIKSAMIENVSANKITAGDIITNNVRVMSDDGKLLISDETIQISDKTRVRVQIGKDAAGDYSINVWDADGKLMFSEGGITDSAIKEAIIRNDMVSDNANISAHKLDINSLFSVINEDGSNTIKSSRIYLSDEEQTLDVAFQQMTTSVDGIRATMQSHGTALDVIQGQISSKVWEQDINTVIDNLEIGDRNLLLKSNSEKTSNNRRIGYWTPSTPLIAGEIYSVAICVTPASGVNRFRLYTSQAYQFLCQLNTSGTTEKQIITGSFTHTYYAGKTPEDDANNALVQLYRYPDDDTITDSSTLHWIKIVRGNKITTDWTPAPEDLEGEVTTLSTKYSSLEQTVNGISTTVASHTTELADKADSGTVVSVQNQVSKLEQTVDGFKTTVSNTYATKTELKNAETTIDQNSKSITAMATRVNNNENNIAQLQLTSDGLTSRVSATETDVDTALTNAANAQLDIDNLEIGGKNLLLNSSLRYDANKWSGNTGAIQHVEKYGRQCSYFKHTSTDTTYYVAQDVLDKLEKNTTYILSGWVMTENIVEGTTNPCIMFYHDGHYDNNGVDTWYGYGTKHFTANVGDGKWEHLTWTFNTDETKLSNATTSKIYIYTRDITGDVYFCDIKLEKGNRDTDWTPAPEDMATNDMIDGINEQIDSTNTRIDTAETLIQQLSDCISMLVTDSNGESLMTQTSTGWTFSMKETNDAMVGLSDSIASLQDTTGDTQATVNALKNAVNDLEATAEYVRVTTYQSEPCIELGESGSEFKLLITNTRIMFMKGSSIPTYIDTTGLVTENITINGELHHGNWVWKQRSNGNYGLQRIG